MQLLSVPSVSLDITALSHHTHAHAAVSVAPAAHAPHFQLEQPLSARALSPTHSLLSRFVLFTNLRWNDDDDEVEVELSGASIVAALVSCPVDLPQARRVRARFVSRRRRRTEGTE